MVYRFLKKQKWISIFVTMIFFMQTVGGVAFAAPQVDNTGKKQFKSVGLASAKVKSGQRSYLPGEVLVKYKPNTSTMAKSKAISSAGVEKTVEELGPKGKPDINRYKLKAGQTVDQAISQLKKDPNVLLAEPNYISKVSSVPNDTYFGEQWGLHNTGQPLSTDPITPAGTADADIDAPEAWDLENGTSNPVTVAVIDSGIDATHPDLAGKIWQNTAESSGTPDVDDNPNGYIDDVNGYNFAGISQYTGDLFASIDGFANPYAQSIKGTGQKLTDIGLVLGKTGSPTENVVVSVRSSLEGADLATATISSAEISTTPSVISKTLSVPVTLTNNVTYYIIVSTTNATSAYDIYFTNSDPYVNGNMQRYDTGAWVNMSSFDLFFMTNANPNPRDDNGHGTHVSGIIGASANDANGVSGVSQGVKIMPLKAGDSSGSFLSTDIIAAINYAADNGADVINMSLGGTSYSGAEQTAIDYAYGKGVVIFAAAGNEGETTNPIEYPAAYNHVIGVGATNMSDARASFSNFNSSVDISAPGYLILSTMPTYPNNIVPDYLPGDEYIYISGTSMATPMAAGVAALMLSADPTLTPAQVESLMTQNADDLGPAGRDDEFGYGRINAYNTLLHMDTVAPTGSVSINNNATYATNTNVTLDLSTADVEPSFGVADMMISNDAAFTGGTWVPYATSTAWTLSAGDGTKTVYIKYRDVSGNVSSDYSDSIILDTAAPTGGSIDINSGATTTTSAIVSLALGATGATEMMISNSASFTGASWEPYSISKTWVLTPGDGSKTVYIKFRDDAGNESTTYNDTIDLNAPPIGAISINNGAGYTNSTSATLNISYSADATQMWISDNAGFTTGTWETVAATKAWTLSATDGTKTVYIKFRDASLQENSYSDTIIFDATAPVGGSVTINGGASSTASTNVTLNISATDTPAGLAEMMISNDSSFSGASWETYAASKSWSLTTGNGTKTVYIKLKDNAGNVTGTYSDSIVLDVPPAPTAAPAPAQYPAPVYPGKLVQKGASGPTVSNIQQKLNSLGFNSGAIDGKFGPKTRAAIIAFQKANGLVPDGIVGPLTWGKLFGSAGGTGYNGPITYGVVNSNVSAIQSKLLALGFNPGPVDGIFGPKSLAAIKAFQRSRGLAADGIVGPLTWKALFG